MKWLTVIILGTVGCAAGDDLGAPRLVRRTSNIVHPKQVAFDADNRPLGLLDTDQRGQLTRLTPRGWEQIAGTIELDISDLGTDADGTPLFTVRSLPSDKSGLFQLGVNDAIMQIGNRIDSAYASDPFQSPWGELFVSTGDGGRRLVHGSEEWILSPTLTQVVRTRTTAYGMSNRGVERMDITDHDGASQVLLACSQFPATCPSMKLDGIDSTGRLYFTIVDADTHAPSPAVYALDAGATALTKLEIRGVQAFASVHATSKFAAFEGIVDDDDGHHEFLYVLRAGATEFELVDLAVHPTITDPVYSIDRGGNMFLADGDWFGTIELE